LKLEDSRAVCRTTDSALLAVAEDLELLGVPLCKEFAEMILVANAPDAEAVAPTVAGAEILAEPPTAAEQTAAQVVYAVSTLAHRPGVPEEVARSLTGRLAFFTARFESYLAERAALEVPSGRFADILEIGE
jgi:hypothetical protein